MLDQTPHRIPSAPPAVGPQPLPYHTPDPAQPVVDTRIRANLRLKDNLLQVVCLVGGAVLGAGVGWALAFARSPGDEAAFAIIGAFVGVLESLFASGAVIGVIRATGGVRRR